MRMINSYLSRRPVILFIIVLLSFGAYVNTLHNGFVYDDENEILLNPWITDIKFIPRIFLSHSWAFKITDSPTSQYHPLKFIVNMVQYQLFESRPWGYHLINILAHMMVSVMVFFVAASLLKELFNEDSLTMPAAASLLFAVHPIHTEAVAWVSAMPELFMSFFYLVSLYIYINLSEQKYRRIIIAAFFFFVSALFKETALTLPLLLIAYDYSFKKGIFAEKGTGASKNALLRRYVPVVIAAIIYLVLRTYAIGGFIPKQSYIKYTVFQIVINAFPLFAKYLAMLVLPVNLTVLHVFRPVSSLFDVRTITSLGFFVFFVLFLIFLNRKNRGLLFGTLWTVVPLLPVFYIPAFLGESVFAERYIYLSSAGFVIVAAIVIRSIKHNNLFKTITIPVLVTGVSAIIVIFTFWTINRNYAWRDDFSLWADAVKKSPDSYVSHINLGKAYYGKGRVSEAIREYQTALLLNPGSDMAFFNIGTIYYEKGMMKDAINAFRAAIALRPDNYEAHNGMGNAYYSTGLIDDAIREYQSAISIRPDYSEAQYNLSVLYTLKGAMTTKPR